MGIIGGLYILLLVLLLAADTFYTSWSDVGQALREPAIQYSIVLSLVSCSVTAVLSVFFAVPIGYLLSRHLVPACQAAASDEENGWSRFRRVALAAVNGVVDTILDIPIVLPPLVIGLSLLILFRYVPFNYIDRYVTYGIPAVILAQFTVACAFAVRTMRVAFEQIDPRREQVALTLGCSRAQAFRRVVLPEARRGILAAGTLAWARALGEFGPILVFAGATRMRTEVLSVTVFLELSIGRLEVAVAVSLLMVGAALAVLVITRLFGFRDALYRATTL
ncbi:MAG: ABC transporter permease [Planctomycetota bacterium]|nr:ABC transporter permease [Planctomycetota bacterium]